MMPCKLNPHRAPRGMTIIEVMIATAILAVLIAMTLMALNIMAKTYAVGAIQGDVQDAARRSIESIAQQVLDSSPSTIQELPALTAGGSPVITFRKAFTK